MRFFFPSFALAPVLALALVVGSGCASQQASPVAERATLARALVPVTVSMKPLQRMFRQAHQFALFHDGAMPTAKQLEALILYNDVTLHSMRVPSLRQATERDVLYIVNGRPWLLAVRDTAGRLLVLRPYGWSWTLTYL